MPISRYGELPDPILEVSGVASLDASIVVRLHSTTGGVTIEPALPADVSPPQAQASPIKVVGPISQDGNQLFHKTLDMTSPVAL